MAMCPVLRRVVPGSEERVCRHALGPDTVIDCGVQVQCFGLRLGGTLPVVVAVTVCKKYRTPHTPW